MTLLVANVALRLQTYEVKLELLMRVKKMKQKEDEIEIKHNDFCMGRLDIDALWAERKFEITKTQVQLKRVGENCEIQNKLMEDL
eukprot:659797-Heterocapsa_arctica.AAC.1